MKRETIFLGLVVMFLYGGHPQSDASAENPGGPAEKPAGTGVIVHSEGYILTAHHVVANARRIVVVTAGEIRNPAVVVSADRDQDLALLKIETVGLSEASLGYAGVVRLDQEVIVAGFSFGLREISVTRGRVTAVRTKGVRRVFQIDAAVNPGNSGGAVFNQRGEIIGIVTTKFNHPSGIAPEGMAFAVPISYATPLLANIPDFDFSTIGAVGKKRKEEKKDRERLVHEVALTTVRIETMNLSEPPATQAGRAASAANQPKTDESREPALVRKPSTSPERAAIERDDADSIAKANQQLATAQREELEKLAQRGILPPEEMALIPAGEFLMGTDDGFPDARPLHHVYLHSYWIDTYEVTNARYRSCVQSGVCLPPKDSKVFADPQRAQHPVTNLTWAQARTFCQWRGRRLPTEAEWEKAARGTDGRRYPWGNRVEVIHNRVKDRDIKTGGNGTEPVGSLPETASPYGVQDLIGNVWEWVQDWYAEDFYAVAPSQDPQGPLRGSFRVLRGGDWSQSAPELRVSVRAWDEMTYWGPALGFRCADDVP